MRSKKSRFITTIIIIVVILCMAIIGSYMIIKFSSPSYDKIAEQLAQSDFGAVNPRICYVDSEIVIVYDENGIVVYSLKDEEICGYGSFPEDGSNFIQGENAVNISASSDGQYVYAYIEQLGELLLKYRFDVSENVFEEVKEKEVLELPIWQPTIYEGNVVQNEMIYSIDNIYCYGENGYCYLGIEPEGDINYSDLRLVVNKNGKQKIYPIFQ